MEEQWDRSECEVTHYLVRAVRGAATTDAECLCCIYVRQQLWFNPPQQDSESPPERLWDCGKKKSPNVVGAYVSVCRRADVLHNTDRRRTDAQMRLEPEPVAFPQRGQLTGKDSHTQVQKASIIHGMASAVILLGI